MIGPWGCFSENDAFSCPNFVCISFLCVIVGFYYKGRFYLIMLLKFLSGSVMI